MRFNEYSLPDIKLFHSTVSAGRRSYREHHHTECELSLFKSGSGIYTVEGRTYTFNPGDIFLFGSNEIHCITQIDSDMPFDLINIHFEPKMLWSEENDHTLILLKLFFDRNEHFANKIDPSNPSTAEIRSAIADIENEFSTMQPGYELKIKLELYSVLLLLLRNYGYVNTQDSSNSGVNVLPQLSLAIDYINSHIGESFSLDDIARQAMLSKAYFSTLFKKYNGLSPWEYITIKRVEKAIGLLRTTDMTKLDIAQQCGFNSSSNFYKAFRKITGKKPDDYQQKPSAVR